MGSVTEPLADGLARVRGLLLDSAGLVRAVAGGRQKGQQPPWRRVELRWVDLKAGPHLQVTSYDATQAHTSNHAAGDDAAAAVDGLLAEPYGNWHVETTTEVVQLRVTKRLDAVTNTKAHGSRDGRFATSSTTGVPDRRHDRQKDRLLPGDDPVLRILGLADAEGRVKPSRQAKYRQVEEFLRILDAAITDALESGRLRRPTAEDPLRVVDLGCGNGYLTFSAARYLTRRGLPVRVTGVDVKEQSRDHNSRVAEELGLDAEFVVGTIEGAALEQRPDVVLALHACDTATDEALARAIGWDVPLVLAAPCCHHDVAAQLRKAEPPAPYSSLVRDGILRERFADTLTDALRALLLRQRGYRVEVVEFVASQHTPRNTLLRAVRTGRKSPDAAQEYGELVTAWHVRPRLAQLLDRLPDQVPGQKSEA